MDRLARYREWIKAYLTKYAHLMWSQPVPGLETFLILDEKSDQYLLLTTGWENGYRSQYTTLHIRLHNGKIWIEEDGTEEGAANWLMEAGVPEEDITLAFLTPEMRERNEVAIA